MQHRKMRREDEMVKKKSGEGGECGMGAGSDEETPQAAFHVPRQAPMRSARPYLDALATARDSNGRSIKEKPRHETDISPWIRELPFYDACQIIVVLVQEYDGHPASMTF